MTFDTIDKIIKEINPTKEQVDQIGNLFEETHSIVNDKIEGNPFNFFLELRNMMPEHKDRIQVIEEECPSQLGPYLFLLRLCEHNATIGLYDIINKYNNYTISYAFY